MFTEYSQNSVYMYTHPLPTFIVVVPASSVVVVEDLRGGPGLQQVVHLVLLPPGGGLAQDLPGLVHVEVPGSQEAQDVLVLGDRGGREERKRGGEEYGLE